jgi:hypothetical protein
MTFTDYAIAAVLILLVIPQVRGRRMTAQSLLLPLAIVAAVAFYYLKSVPTTGNDVALDLVLILVGAVLGALAGFFTRVGRNGEGHLYSRAGAAAAVLWIVGMAGRGVFEFYATHGGAHSVASFSIAHQITGSDAWTAALVLMALAQVVVRLGVICLKARTVPAPAAARA